MRISYVIKEPDALSSEFDKNGAGDSTQESSTIENSFVISTLALYELVWNVMVLLSEVRVLFQVSLGLTN